MIYGREGPIYKIKCIFYLFIAITTVAPAACQVPPSFKVDLTKELQSIFGGPIYYPDLLRKNSRLSEDGRLSFTELAAKYGHPAEEHYVVTEDGYNLTLFRLAGDPARPALLVHGNTVDADCYLARGNTSLAVTLAARGHDVWVLSWRGTIYSQRHLSIDPAREPQRFFDFSFYELGVFDLPATIDYVLARTGQARLLAIGYSVGTTMFYVMGAEKPEYNDKIKLMISLAPICFLKNVQGSTGEMKYLGFLSPVLPDLSGAGQVSGRNQLVTYVYQSFCLNSPSVISYELCVRNLLFSQFGVDGAGFEPEFISTFYGHYPGGSTVKMFLHLLQVIDRDEFARYDYGDRKNRELYNSTEPPKFDLSKVTMRVALLVGREDYLATVRDVQRLRDQLPNVVRHQVLPYQKFNHLDFAYGRNMTDNLYPYLLDLVEQYI